MRAAGGVVARGSRGGGFEIALIYRSTHGDWSFPKGKLEPGETELFCARREVEEETGLLCNIGAYLGQGVFDQATADAFMLVAFSVLKVHR